MAVNNNYLIRLSRRRLYISIKVLKLRERKVVVNLASRRDSNNLIAR